MASSTPQTPRRTLRLGTRASPLARAQATLARDALIAAAEQAQVAVKIALVPLTTSGDSMQNRALAEVGGKALWTRELDHALATGQIDIAVHSMKDVETIRPPELIFGAILPRADARDRLIVRTAAQGSPQGSQETQAKRVRDLPHGARVGTSSPRRTAQLLALRPDLEIVLLRGNLATRLARLAAGHCDATLLAAAGLDRLGLGDVGTAQPLDAWLPAAAQGAIGLECRAEDRVLRRLLASVTHHSTAQAIHIERAFLAALGGDCHTPAAVYCSADTTNIADIADIAQIVDATQAIAKIKNGTPTTPSTKRVLILRATLYATDGSAEIRDRVVISANSMSSTDTISAADNAIVSDLATAMVARAPASIRGLFIQQER